MNGGVKRPGLGGVRTWGEAFRQPKRSETGEVASTRAAAAGKEGGKFKPESRRRWSRQHFYVDYVPRTAASRPEGLDDERVCIYGQSYKFMIVGRLGLSA